MMNDDEQPSSTNKKLVFLQMWWGLKNHQNLQLLMEVIFKSLILITHKLTIQ
ncbi:hypothetical protein HanRHA438_Chr01g0002301 [Helianthus annuus]|nr:hypothetical protein HanRHA438_Chr01g0002301 [Helianthus annuus]